ncbi:GAF domain-containing protein [Falsiroseomonas selenitidurans]|uniref:GAF domain-containing protein n=1 Tax=Falsiroseomonas selenitidurans TaxID=2716335 RepID=A0ABX1EB00_9PROT|nr:GAF domain-containing protein [Falsiroseomonas selenitidurans]NKC32662.1 GAF domain-containing protein [Falsiroseomonas selenitidurans]
MDLPGTAAGSPAFGNADLSNCEREQIHLAASIQPHGALLALREPDLVVLQASANARAFLGLDASPLGRPLAEFAPAIARAVMPLLADPLDEVPAAARIPAGAGGVKLDAQIHRPAGIGGQAGGLVLELERAALVDPPASRIEPALQAILGSYALRPLCEEVARIFRKLTGYDRVMVYRFDDDGHGEVFAEEHEPGLEPYLGNRYPASDIPEIARRLYIRNRVRVLTDVHYAPVPLEPRLSPLTGQDLDMSLCALRSSSPMHVQYLKNMGVGATLVASILVGGRLWGLVSCHHQTPRRTPFAVRAVTELLAEAVGTRIAALESFVQSQAELAVRRLEQRMIEAITRDGDWRTALFDNPQTLLLPMGASGAALLFEGQTQTAGEVPGTAGLREIGKWLDSRARGPTTHAPVIATASLVAEAPHLGPLTRVAAGVLAAPISTAPGEYLVWFRPEQVSTVTWGGDPTKPVLVGDDPRDLSPRRSFAKWNQVVEGRSEPWSPKDLATARLVGDTVTDVVLQFRSVRMLIAEDQLAQVRRQVGLSAQPVVICDPAGNIDLRNEAFDRLMPGLRGAAPRRIDHLLPYFADPADVGRRLRDVLDNGRSWRGEVRLADGQGGGRPVLVRADPVFSAPDRVLGFVFLFNDLAERKAAEAARRRFQAGIEEGSRQRAGRLDRQADLTFQAILASVVENAQLAALEIADGVDVARMPDLLESVRASVARTAAVLETLIRHASEEPPPEAED